MYYQSIPGALMDMNWTILMENICATNNVNLDLNLEWEEKVKIIVTKSVQKIFIKQVQKFAKNQNITIEMNITF